MLADRLSCTGCGACGDACAKGAIWMGEDEDGFRYPKIDETKCVKCGACARVCPILNAKVAEEVPTRRYYAARLKDHGELKTVSSGGAFVALAKAVLRAGGVVYGVVQKGVNDIRHARAETEEDLTAMRRSKYLPSDTTGIYRQVKADLDSGRKVLFSGTGCQIGAVKAYVGKSCDNLIACDVVCHGIPSLTAWRSYRREVEEKFGSRMTSLVFRDKGQGWSKNAYRIRLENGHEIFEPSVLNPFHFGYLQGLFYRSSCAECKFVGPGRAADITLADYWRYEGPLKTAEDIGLSLIVVSSDKGQKLLDEAAQFLELEASSKEMAEMSCAHLEHPPKISADRTKFLNTLRQTGYGAAIDEYLPKTPNKQKEPFLQRRIRKLKKSLAKWKGPRVKDAEVAKQVVDYWALLGRRVVVPTSAIESLKLLFHRIKGKEIISEHELDRRIAKLKHAKLSELITAVPDATRFYAMKDALLLLAKKGVSVYFYNRVGKEKAESWRYAPSAERRMEAKLGFPTLHSEFDSHIDDLKELFGEKFSKDYVNAMAKIPRVVEVCGESRHEDCKTPYVNVLGGRRVTAFQPENAKHTLRVYGRCGVFGYAVEDAETMPSRLQKALLDAGITDYKVENYGLWGGSDACVDDNFLRHVAGMKAGDVVVFYRMHYFKPLQAELERYGLRYKEITHEWHLAPEAKWCFYDRPGHMNRDGYKLVAKILAQDLIAHKFARLEPEAGLGEAFDSRNLTRYLKNSVADALTNELVTYLDKVLKVAPPIDKAKTVGSIVMNCNPFTVGHRYLIEYAAARVDRLYIFVVEEDRSFFSFADRFEMVKAGTADLKNVVVVPSGRFIISSMTFPEYFLKDQVKNGGFDVSSDVKTFCERIAPALNITQRFVGQEPFDPVTANYNRCMHEMLPKYGMVLHEIPRYELSNGQIVNATEVRRLLQLGDEEALKTVVPESTMIILKDHYCS